LKKNFKKLLCKENIFLDLKSCKKQNIITEIIDRLHSAGMITNKEKVLESVMEREKKMTTGMEHGIALPHGKTDAVDDLVVAIGLKNEGVDFDCAVIIISARFFGLIFSRYLKQPRMLGE